MKHLLLMLVAGCWATLLACGQTNPSAPAAPKTERNTAAPAGQGLRIPEKVGSVNDYEQLFSEEEEEQLAAMIQDFETRTSIEIVVVTLDSTQSTKAGFDQQILDIGNSWGVGKKDKNNGIAIGISAGLRKIRIQNGLGIERKLSDGQTGMIIGKYFLPQFKNGAYFEGTRQGVQAIMTHLSGG